MKSDNAIWNGTSIFVGIIVAIAAFVRGALLLPPETVLRHLPWLETPARLEKPLRNGGKLPVSAFEGGEKVPEGGDACLWLSGELMGVARRQNHEWKIRTWLGE